MTLIEPVPIDDDYCDGLALLEHAGPNVRLVIFARQTIYETGESANALKRKLVMPRAALHALHDQVGRFLRQSPHGLRLVR